MTRKAVVAKTELPPVKRSPYDWAFVAKRLEENPGLWVMVPDVSNGLLSKIKSGRNRWLAALGGDLRAHQRNTRLVVGARGTSRRGELWLRWTPEGHAEPSTYEIIDTIEEGE